MEFISEDVVVLIQRDKTYRPFKLRKGRKLNFEKVSFYPDAALGHRYGSCFKVERQQLQLVEEVNSNTVSFKAHSGESGSDNQKICDDGTSQELTEGDVKVMKGQGLSGQGIVASMVEHSCSFKDKTKFSQEKYIRKKEKKYVPIFRFVRTTTKLLCELYFSQSPNKTYFLRVDTLAQILTQSNIHAHSNMIVMETCQGFMVGAMLERMGGYGKLVQIFHGDYPVRTILDNFGHLSSTDRSILMMYPLQRVGSLLTVQESSQIASIYEKLASSSQTPRDKLKNKSRGKEENMDRGQKTKSVSSQNSDGCLEPACKKTRIEEVKSCKEVVDRHRDCSQTSEEVNMEVSGPTGTEEQQMDVEGSDCQVVQELEDTSSQAVQDEVLVSNPQDEEDTSSRVVRDEVLVSNPQDEEDTSSLAVQDEVLVSNPQDEEERFKHSVQKENKRREREEAYMASEDLLSQRKMDGLVVMCRHHPEPVVMALVKFVAPSRPIVVCCHLLEPLVQCYKTLKESAKVFNLQISETWMRRYQVLEERTHPEMMMNGQSGYILTGVVVN